MEFVGGPLGSCIGELELKKEVGELKLKKELELKKEVGELKLKKELVFMQAKVEASEKEKNSVLAKNLELERNYNILNNDKLESEKNNELLKTENASYKERINELSKGQAKERQRVSELQKAKAVLEADAIKAIEAMKGNAVKANAALKKVEDEKIRLGFLVSALGESMENATVESVTKKIREGSLVLAWEESMESTNMAWQKKLSEKDAELVQSETAKESAKKHFDRRIKFWREKAQILQDQNLDKLERLRARKRSIKSLEKIYKESGDKNAVLEKDRAHFKRMWQDCSRELQKQKKSLNAEIAAKEAVIVTKEDQVQRLEGLYDKMKEEDALKAKFFKLVQVVSRVVGDLRAAREEDSKEKGDAIADELLSYIDYVEGDVKTLPDFKIPSFESRPDSRVVSLGRMKDMFTKSGEKILDFVTKEAQKKDKKDALEAKKKAKREKEKEKKKEKRKEKKKERKELAIETKTTGNLLTYEDASMKPSGNFVQTGSPDRINWVRVPLRGEGAK